MEDESSSFVTLLFSVVLTGTIVFLVRKFFKGAQFNERVSAKEKVAVVTGANCGIGLETVCGLNLAKAKVYMLCRNENKANEAKIKLVKKGCDATRIFIEHCDFMNLDSVRACAKRILQAESKIDILVNNAGVVCTKYAKSVDGHEETWQANYLGPFLLTELLLPALKKSTGGRIVNVSSELHQYSNPLNLTKIDEKSHFGSYKSYNRSKLANVMHARELTKRIRSQDSNVSINSLHPGVVDTDLPRNTLLNATPIRQISIPFKWFFFKTTKDGAQTSLFLSLSKKVDGISGKYFRDCKLANESAAAKDDGACNALYEYSLKQVGLAK